MPGKWIQCKWIKWEKLVILSNLHIQPLKSDESNDANIAMEAISNQNKVLSRKP
jgi:hypothetical protein